MRIISKDGDINIPFETNHLYIQEYKYNENGEVYILWDIMFDNNKLLEVYSTEEKALKVMEMIWQPRYWVSSNALINDGDFVPGFERYVFYMPKDEDVK